GHIYGDNILKEFAHYVKNFAREHDIVVRYGGEEFTILLTHTDIEGAIKFSERLLENLKKHVFDAGGNKIRIKITAGLASFPHDGGDAGTVSGILDLADRALIRAKEQGGDRLLTFRSMAGQERHIADRKVKNSVVALQKKFTDAKNRASHTLLESISVFAKTIEAKDHYTGEHVESIVSLVEEIGKRLDLPEWSLENLKHAAVLHDLGKIGIPDNILTKKGRLTPEEYEKIKKHPQIAAEILRPMHFLSEVVPLILYHHERYDGSGYCAGLKGKEIPLGARIIAIADVYHALIADRPYRKAYNKKDALEIVRKGSGTQFDPDIVEIFMKIMEPED
ncbi:MAG: diguanylate cyclase, partial [Candidatus Omnitrophota bacterium]